MIILHETVGAYRSLFVSYVALLKGPVMSDLRGIFVLNMFSPQILSLYTVVRDTAGRQSENIFNNNYLVVKPNKPLPGFELSVSHTQNSLTQQATRISTLSQQYDIKLSL